MELVKEFCIGFFVVEETKMELNSTRVIHLAQDVQKRTTQKEYNVKCLLP